MQSIHTRSTLHEFIPFCESSFHSSSPSPPTVPGKPPPGTGQAEGVSWFAWGTDNISVIFPNLLHLAPAESVYFLVVQKPGRSIRQEEPGENMETVFLAVLQAQSQAPRSSVEDGCWLSPLHPGYPAGCWWARAEGNGSIAG